MVANKLQWKAYKATQVELKNSKDERRDEQLVNIANKQYDEILDKIKRYSYGDGENGIYAIYRCFIDINRQSPLRSISKSKNEELIVILYQDISNIFRSN